MGIIEQYMNGPCRITVYDDSIRPPEEVEEIINRVSEIVYNEQFRRHMEEKRRRGDNTENV